MANESGTNPHNSNPQGEGQGSGEKLILGKFKTVEEAVEQGYSGLEKGYHETRQEMRELRDLIESRLPEPQYGQTQKDNFVPQGGDQRDPSTQFLTRFYQDPLGTLEQYHQAKQQQQMEVQSRAEAQAARNREALARWSEKNTDLQPYGDLLAFYVQQTDGRLSAETRLEQAAKKVRERVNELRGQSKQSGPKPEDHVEPPSGGTPGQAQSKPQPQTQSSGSPLATLIAQRNAARKPQKPGAR